MRARTTLLLLSMLAAVVLAGCADDAGEGAESSDDPLAENGSSAMCVEGAADCDDTATMETVDDPSYIGT